MFVFLALFNSFLRGLLPPRSSLMPGPLPVPMHSSWQALRLRRMDMRVGCVCVNEAYVLIDGFYLNFIHVVVVRMRFYYVVVFSSPLIRRIKHRAMFMPLKHPRVYHYKQPSPCIRSARSHGIRRASGCLFNVQKLFIK